MTQKNSKATTRPMSSNLGETTTPPLRGTPPQEGNKRHTKNYQSLPYNPQLKERAKALRKTGNLSEVLLWNQLKRGQFLGLDFDRMVKQLPSTSARKNSAEPIPTVMPSSAPSS